LILIPLLVLPLLLLDKEKRELEGDEVSLILSFPFQQEGDTGDGIPIMTRKVFYNTRLDGKS
jgi:hypothetical protein